MAAPKRSDIFSLVQTRPLPAVDSVIRGCVVAADCNRTGGTGNGFNKCGFAAAVFAHKEGYRRSETELAQRLHHRDVEGEPRFRDSPFDGNGFEVNHDFGVMGKCCATFGELSSVQRRRSLFISFQTHIFKEKAELRWPGQTFSP